MVSSYLPQAFSWDIKHVSKVVQKLSAFTYSSKGFKAIDITDVSSFYSEA
jgi:hypothetical protein